MPPSLLLLSSATPTSSDKGIVLESNKSSSSSSSGTMLPSTSISLVDKSSHNVNYGKTSSPTPLAAAATSVPLINKNVTTVDSSINDADDNNTSLSQSATLPSSSPLQSSRAYVKPEYLENNANVETTTTVTDVTNMNNNNSSSIIFNDLSLEYHSNNNRNNNSNNMNIINHMHKSSNAATAAAVDDNSKDNITTNNNNSNTDEMLLLCSNPRSVTEALTMAKNTSDDLDEKEI
ncbi:uncharacterized protein [Musca autumnalis]|uniref:uncharacterized protein n=1 Tax=Musca autumnalis TaxID=221902 RepID=UPI003CF955FC